MLKKREEAGDTQLVRWRLGYLDDLGLDVVRCTR
jgi:hypothetical protein